MMNSRENEGKIKKKEWKKGAWSFFSPFFLILTINYRFTNKKLIKKITISIFPQFQQQSKYKGIKRTEEKTKGDG